MIDRRSFGLALGAIAAVSASGAGAQIAFSGPIKGPWTDGGQLQRAGGVLNYATIGDASSVKPPVILLHKLGGWLADWRHVAPLMMDGRHVIAFDLPGHGDSRWQGPAPYIQTLSETAALLVGAFDEMGIAKVDLIGTSLGGCVAVPLAAHFPERVHKLALVSSALGGARTLAEIKTAVDAGQTSFFTAAGDPIAFDASVSKKIMGHVNGDVINAEQNSSRKQAGRWIQPSERGVAITDIKALLKRIESPTLLLYGENPNSYLRFRADAEAALKTSRTEIIPNSGAFTNLDNPKATAAALLRFINAG